MSQQQLLFTKYVKVSTLQDTMNSAKVNDSNRCDVCSKTFKRRHVLLKHQRIVHNMDTLKEKHQAKIAASKSPIPFQFSHTPRTTPEFVCSHCDQPFLSKLCRDKHERNHIAMKTVERARRDFAKLQIVSCMKLCANKLLLHRHNNIIK